MEKACRSLSDSGVRVGGCERRILSSLHLGLHSCQNYLACDMHKMVGKMKVDNITALLLCVVN